MPTRSDVVFVARTCLETPYHHSGRQVGRGLDCAGLVIHVGKMLGIFHPDFDVPPYDKHPDGVTMTALCDEHMDRIPRSAMQPGDVVLLEPDNQPQHLGIVGDYRHGGFSLIHACNALSVKPPRVIETRLMFARNMKFVACYSFKGVR